MFTLRTRNQDLNPFALTHDLRRQLDWFFGSDLFEGQLPDRATAAPRFWAHRDDAGLHVQADLPGIKAENLSLRIEGGVVHIEGERRLEAPEGYRAVRSERVAGRFERRFTLPKDVDADAVQATLKDGVLTLDFPLRPKAEPKVIDIKIA